MKHTQEGFGSIRCGRSTCPIIGDHIFVYLIPTTVAEFHLGCQHSLHQEVIYAFPLVKDKSFVRMAGDRVCLPPPAHL
jgi:hypothetical protein